MTMADAKGELDYWRKFFRSAKGDIFELIDKAILLAAAECPMEFKNRKNLIVEKLYTSLNNGDEDPKEEIQIVGEVMKIKNLLSNNRYESDSSLYESLSRLQFMQLSVETLNSTEIRGTVNDLQKHNSNQIRNLARTLIDGWEVLVDEWVKSTAATTGNTITDSINILNNPSFTDSNSPQNESKQFDEVSYMSKLEMEKRKLRGGYERLEKARKKRMVQIIELRDLPMDSHEKGKRKKKPGNHSGN